MVLLGLLLVVALVDRLALLRVEVNGLAGVSSCKESTVWEKPTSSTRPSALTLALGGWRNSSPKTVAGVHSIWDTASGLA
jgi:hypothetical protein